MAPSKKKAGKAAASKADGSAGINSSSSSSSSAAASTKQQLPVSTRPKRHAEKRFYDYIEDERPQHLTGKIHRKKRATAVTDYDDELAPMSNGNMRSGVNGNGNGGREGGRKGGERGAASNTHGGGGRGGNSRLGGRQSDENGRDDVDTVERQGGRGHRGGRGNAGRALGRGGRPRQRRRTAAVGWRGRFAGGIGDDEVEDEMEETEAEGRRGMYHEEEEANNDNWAQCDTCKKWRRLPDFVDPNKLPAKWFCDMNKFDPTRASCRAPQEATHSTQLDDEDEEPERGTRSGHRRRQQETDNEDDDGERGMGYDDEGQDYDDDRDGEDDDGDLDDEENEVKDENLRRFLAAWARRVKGEDKAESRLATSMSTRGKRKPMGDTNWIRCQNCGKWRALLKSMDPSIYVGPGLKFYCLMNTWHESLASCSAPQENHYTVANLFPPQDPPQLPTDYDETKDEEGDDGEETFVGREQGGTGDRNDDGQRGDWGDEYGGGEYVGGSAWGRGGDERPPLAQYHQPAAAGRNYGYDEQGGYENFLQGGRQPFCDGFYP